MQPALGSSEHVNNLRTRTATTIAYLRNFEKLPLELAMKVFELKVMPMIRYGLSSIAPRQSKTSMMDLDKCKTMYLKVFLGLSRHTSNTFVLALTDEKTLCEDLTSMGFAFTQKSWTDYSENLDQRRALFQHRNFTGGPALQNDQWTGSAREFLRITRGRNGSLTFSPDGS